MLVFRRLATLGFLFLIALVASSAVADSPWKRKQLPSVGAFDGDLAKVEAAMRDREWERANRKAEKLAKRVLHDTQPTLDGKKVLARLAIDRAAIFWHLGEREDAEWYWDMAAALDRRTASRLDPALDGEATDFFREMKPRFLNQVPPGFQPFTDFERPGFVPPTENRDEPLHFPRSLGYSARSDEHVRPFQVEVLIDRRGRMRRPVLEDSHHPLVVYHYLEQLYRRGVEPATVDGEPVDLVYLIGRRVIDERWSTSDRTFEG